MDLTRSDLDLLAALEDGLPLVPRPYAELARQLGTDEAVVIAMLGRLIERGVVSRFGIIVHHRELGYRANAMVVWDVPDERVRGVGRRLVALPYIALCYSRPRRPPAWPYNLYCMIFAHDRAAARRLISETTAAGGLAGLPRSVLFSTRRFKQRGARYGATARDGDGSERWMTSTVA